MQKLYYILLLMMLPFLCLSQDDVTAGDDYQEIDEGIAVNINVLINDFGIGIHGVRMEIQQQPQHGTASVEDDNTIRYQPDLNFAGLEVFSYRVYNSLGKYDDATVEVRVRSVNYKPNPQNDTVDIYHDERLYIDVLANDLKVYDAPISISIIEDLKNGQANINSEQKIFAEFDRFFYGLDSCTYEIVDVDNDRGVAKVYFNVKAGDAESFYIPQAFSPNGDGINDRFYIPELAVLSNVKLQIYDVHGTLIYNTNDYKNDWDAVSNIGVMKGRKCKPGVYYYFMDVPGHDERITGYIYLSYS